MDILFGSLVNHIWFQCLSWSHFVSACPRVCDVDESCTLRVGTLEGAADSLVVRVSLQTERWQEHEFVSHLLCQDDFTFQIEECK